jgi:hypothetical protein
MMSVSKNITVMCMVAWAFVSLFHCTECTAQDDHAEADSPIPSLEYGFESDLASKYLWRGLSFSDGVVSQNSLWLSAHGVTASVWGNYDFRAATANPSLNEIDLGLSHSFEFKRLTLESSVQAFLYPDQPESPWTSELAVTILANLPYVQPFMTHNLDIKEYGGAYFGSAGIQAERSLGEMVTLDGSAQIGYGSAKYNSTYIGLDRAGFEFYEVTAGLTVYLSSTIYLRPHGGVSTLHIRDLDEWVESPTQYQVGIAFGGEFAWAN